VPFFVAVFREIEPSRLEATLATIRADLAASRRLHPARRDARVFQRLNYPTHLVEIAEWDTPADYEHLRQTARYQEALASGSRPARVEHLTRLRLFARMSVPATVAGCVLLTVPARSAVALEAFILGDVRHGVEAAAGLVTHEVYRVEPEAGRLLVVHSWRTIEDLERFRAGDRRQYDAALRELGVTTERLTAVVAVELSRLDG
jgi:heme-degrading monooxygenase HmoA